MRRGLWAALVASALLHAGAAWQLFVMPRAHVERHARDTFQVRMVALPPPAPEVEAPPPAPPAPPAPPPKPKPPQPKAAPPKPELPSRPAEPSPEAPEPKSAPAALLADTGPSTTGGVVQLVGAPVSSLATAMSTLTEVTPKPAVRPAGPPLAKLSDLSRKPRAPSLDAALRDNYPPELRRRGLDGQAEVRVVIDARGRVREIAIISESASGFAEACRRTLLGSRWSEPLDRDGRPVSTRLTYRCRFQIER